MSCLCNRSLPLSHGGLVGLSNMTVSFSGHNRLLFEISKHVKLIPTAIVKINRVRVDVVS